MKANVLNYIGRLRSNAYKGFGLEGRIIDSSVAFEDIIVYESLNAGGARGGVTRDLALRLSTTFGGTCTTTAHRISAPEAGS
jgi:hypothetical protein